MPATETIDGNLVRSSVDRPHRLAVVLVASLFAGLLLGPIDLAAQKLLAYPWANLANSSAVWALGAFCFGRWVQGRRWLPALAGSLMLIVAVETYFLAATIVLHDSVETLVSTTTLIWLVFGVGAGALFGTAGAWSGAAGRTLSTLGIAIAGSVLFAEALILIRRVGGVPAADRTAYLQTALIEAIIGIAVFVLASNNHRQRLFALAASVPITSLGFGAFLIGGFGQ
jgi:Family of unknown function (DUF6518)